MRTSRSPATVMTANGEVQRREEATENVKQFDLFVKVMFLEETPAVLSLGSSAKIMGIPTAGQAVKNHISPKMSRELISIYQTMYHLWFLVFQRVPLRYPHLLLHHLHHRILHMTLTDTPKNPVPERSGSMSEGPRRNPLHESTETENKNKNEGREEVQRYIYIYIYIMNCQIGCRNSERIWSMNGVRQSHGETLRPRIETLPVLLMNYQ